MTNEPCTPSCNCPSDTHTCDKGGCKMLLEKATPFWVLNNIHKEEVAAADSGAVSIT